MERKRCIMIAHSPKECELISSGDKRSFTRKLKPKLKLPFKGYMYCTLSGGLLQSVNGKVQKVNCTTLDLNVNHITVRDLNGYVIGAYLCENIHYDSNMHQYVYELSDTVIYKEPYHINKFITFCKFAPCSKCEHLIITERGLDCNYEKVNLTVQQPPKTWIYVDGLWR